MFYTDRLEKCTSNNTVYVCGQMVKIVAQKLLKKGDSEDLKTKKKEAYSETLSRRNLRRLWAI